MLSKETQLEVAKLLEQHELAISGLYKAYAQTFPKHKTAWQKLAMEEINHAERIHDFLTRLSDGSVQISATHSLLPEIIQASLDSIADELKKAQSQNMLPIDAIATAMDLEESMIEDKWFMSLQGDSPLVKRVLEALASGTRKHAQELQAMMAMEDGVAPKKRPEVTHTGMKKL